MGRNRMGEDMKHEYKLNGIDFLETKGETLMGIHQGGVDCYYPWKEPIRPSKIKYVLMDLDGTSVKSEEFWVYIIERTTAMMLGDNSFKLAKEDAPFVQGFTTAEHLSYTKKKYGYHGSVGDALTVYHKIAKEELLKAMQGVGKKDAFKSREGLKNFLLALKEKGIKIGLATSGLDYKAMPEIIAAFDLLDLGKPEEFYDAIITGGRRKEKGEYGTMGELVAKPHPWIYKELGAGLNIKDEREAVVIEDSSAGVISGKLAGYPVIGFKDGNILESGLSVDCYKIVSSFEEILKLL